LLLEQVDFAHGTSSRSTKLVHGGVRYLAQGNIQLVFSALRERGLLLRNAPHLVRKQSFLIPCYSLFERVKYYTGLKLYDWLAGNLSFGSSKYLTAQKLAHRIPNIKTKGLQGAVEYFDGQFDDARLAINLAQTAVNYGAVVLNYFQVNNLIKDNERVSGVMAQDLENHNEYRLKAKVVVNATGVFVDDIIQMDDAKAKPLIRTSQGAHIVVSNKFLGSSSALMVPKTSDGRVMFAVPWHEHIIIGTTDTPLPSAVREPIPLEKEINFIIETFNQYSNEELNKKSILSAFAGLRPLATAHLNARQTKEISRDHKVVVSASGLVTVSGGKWTTYRKMAEDAVNVIIRNNGFPKKPCLTKTIRIQGYTLNASQDHYSVYGSDATEIQKLIQEDDDQKGRLVPHLPYTNAEVVWAIRKEMARTIEDVLARRLRILFLDAKAAVNAAGVVADILQRELRQTDEWKQQQLTVFLKLANQYLPQAGNTISD